MPTKVNTHTRSKRCDCQAVGGTVEQIGRDRGSWSAQFAVNELVIQ